MIARIFGRARGIDCRFGCGNICRVGWHGACRGGTRAKRGPAVSRQPGGLCTIQGLRPSRCIPAERLHPRRGTLARRGRGARGKLCRLRAGKRRSGLRGSGREGWRGGLRASCFWGLRRCDRHRRENQNVTANRRGSRGGVRGFEMRGPLVGRRWIFWGAWLVAFYTAFSQRMTTP